ncbi:unnamed protein product [Rangifer tarandus platyrhynchus]|uniref:Uncharacterized protein n=1 Tax=Rangifer tarandus platyrhynchus TaxID=3082113 RepID=A0ABN8Z289_RANTA|nr:unnamed protein product [Rangifer tarandus platyrhynchus]
MGFSRQEYLSRLPFPSPEDLSNPEIEHRAPILQADSLPSELQGSPLTYFLSLDITFVFIIAILLLKEPPKLYMSFRSHKICFCLCHHHLLHLTDPPLCILDLF